MVANKQEMIQLVTAICEKILCNELKDPQVLAALVEALIEKIKPLSKDLPIDVTLSKQHYVLLESRLDEITGIGVNCNKVHFHADPMMAESCCTIKTPIGIIGFDISRELENIENMLTSGVEE